MPAFSLRCRTDDPVVLGRQLVGELAGAVGRAVVHDQHPEALRRGAREHLAGRRDDRAHVLGLVVGGQYQPRLAGHQIGAYPRQSARGAIRAYPVRRWPSESPQTPRSPRRSRNSADLYELDGAIVHRVVAYRGAAKAVREATVSVAALARQGRATELKGIGKTLQEKIVDLAETGTIPAAERLRAKFPPGLVELTHLPGLGRQARPAAVRRARGGLRRGPARGGARPARARASRASARSSRNASCRRSPTTAARPPRGSPARVILSRATEIAAGAGGGAGGARRSAAPRCWSPARCAGRPTASRTSTWWRRSTAPAQLAAQLAALEQIESVSSAGEAGARGLTHSGIPVELRIAAPEQRGNLLQHLTGSGAHNAALRELAVRRGLHLSEYGVLDDASGLTTTCAERGGGVRARRACPTSSPSCARTAASCRRHATGRCRG